MAKRPRRPSKASRVDSDAAPRAYDSDDIAGGQVQAAELEARLRAEQAATTSATPAASAAGDEHHPSADDRDDDGSTDANVTPQLMVYPLEPIEAEAVADNDARRAPARPKRPSRLILRTFAAAAVLFLIAVSAVAVWALHDVPWQAIADRRGEPVVVLADASGEPLRANGPRRDPDLAFGEFPEHLIDAVLATEDRRFLDHNGIDIMGIGRAVMRNLSAGGVVQGGSTITQQLVKVLYLDPERTMRRKIQEAVIAVWLDARLTKEEILALYLNNIYLGAGATGMPAAASVYFGKSPDELSVAEAAILAGIIRAPSALNPFDNLDGARARALLVIDAMEETGKLDNGAADAARSELSSLRPERAQQRPGSWFADWAGEEARKLASNFADTVRVETTLDPDLQEIADRVVTDMLDRDGAKSGAGQAALVALRPDGAVLAMTGGRDYGDSTFNRAVTAQRQPGSTFKLFVYYAALKDGFTPNHLVDDAPVDINGWKPANFSGRYYGRVTLAEAFARSLNAATVNLAQEVGIDNVAAAARELGIDAPLTETPALALGASEVTLLDLTGAYASVRAGMAPVEPWGIASFGIGEDQRSLRVGPARRPTVSLEAHHEELVRMLELVVERGTGRNARTGGLAAGKTGTSQNSRDAWFVGFTQDLVVGVWVGNDDGKPMSEVTGGGLPARIWQRFVKEAETLGPRNVPLAAMQPDQVVAEAETRISEAQPQAPAWCNVDACGRRYNSFRADDCSYQPYRGGRRTCDIPGTATTAQDAAEDVQPPVDASVRTGSVDGPTYVGEYMTPSGPRMAPAQRAQCNYDACSRAYRSFDPGDCSYKPYGRPRQLCIR